MGSCTQGLDYGDLQRVQSLRDSRDGFRERWHVDCVNPVKHREVKSIVRGCFWGKQRGPLVPLKTDSVNARVYRDLLHRWLLPVLEDVRAAPGNPLFQQDNAKIHTVKTLLIPLESILTSYSSNHPRRPEKVEAKLAEVFPLC